MWLQDGSTEVGIVAICGMSGIGKTTIAKYVFNLNFERFEASSFLANIREVSGQLNGLIRLQRQLLSNISKGKKKEIWNVDEGIIRIRDAISSKRVLLVFDDMDYIDHFEPILGMRGSLHAGSKIIITTRDMRLLPHEFYKIHDVEIMSFDESYKLFSWHAFGQDYPFHGYAYHSKKVVKHCGGLPLAIKVLGSSLRGKGVDVWKSALEKLEVIADQQIFKKLVISYNSLPDDHDKNLFLDIACFFLGKDKDYMVAILDECGFYSIVGIQNLVDRCLLVIDSENKLTMHNMVRDMGREVIRQQSPKELGNRTRLWHYKDSFQVLREIKGSGTITGLALDMRMVKEDQALLSNQHNSVKRRRVGFLSWHSVNTSSVESADIYLTTGAFTCMRELSLLQINFTQLIGGYEEFPKNLRWLCWQGFPKKFVPSDFPLESLVAIDMRNSRLEQVWKGNRFLGLLKILDLSHSHELIRTPDFVLLPQLGRLILEDCVSLVEVHESIGNLDTKLIVLNLKDCINLRNLPRNICMLKALETLVISGCSNLGEFPKEIRKMESLKVFHADKIPMSPSASTTSEDGLWPALISKWVTRPRKCPKLSWDYLPYSIVSLSLSDCNLHDYSFPMDFSNLPSLKKLDLSLNPLCSLPDCIRGLTSLERLDMFSCKSLQELIDLPRITDLVLENCISLEKMTFQSKVYESKAPVPLIGGCKKLVHMEGSFKLETIKNLDNEVMKCLGMYQYDLQALNNFEVTLYNACTGTERKGPIQVLFERCITNIFLPEGEVPGWFSSKSVGSSISIIVPSFSSSNSKILGLNVCIVYAIDKHWHPNSLFYIVVSNQTKNLKFNYFPMCYGLLKPDEYITWSSHWKFHKSQMDIGDQLNISLATDPCFKVKEIGVRLVYDEQAHSSDDVVLMKALNRLGDTYDALVVDSDTSALTNPEREIPSTKATDLILISMADMKSHEAASHDVFLSFRGEDTRKTFVDHLYTALVGACFRTFRDNEGIDRGEKINSELERAILQSRCSIIVLSENYPSSRWCLDELVLILQHKRKNSWHVVLPLFYNVDPSNFRNLKGRVGDAFAVHERKGELPEKVEVWREALGEVVDLSGMHLQNGHEAQFIQEVVEVIEEKLKRTIRNVPPNLVGIESRAKDINLWLQDCSTGAGIVAIYGMSGIGKTTLAKYVFNLNFKRFAASSFLENIREVSGQQDGLIRLQRQLLSDISRGIKKELIRDAMCSKRILLVLDDMDNRDQFEEILGMRESLHPGTKIIITTRHMWWLPHEFDEIHYLEKMGFGESFKLFNWHAFGQEYPFDAYANHSRSMVMQCGGLPLALKVLGSSLRGKGVDIWKRVLEKLEAINDHQIFKKLVISYDCLLDDHDKNLFLEIACFFLGKDKDYMVTILEECGFHTIYGIQNLVDRCLLTIDPKNKLTMHQMVRDMGREVIRRESPREPGKRTRLWHYKDSFHVLRGNTGSGTITGLALDMKMVKEDKSLLSNQHYSLKQRRFGFLSWQSVYASSAYSHDVYITTDAFTSMRSLSLLQINYTELIGGYEEFPKNLRWLCWRGFPKKCVPSDFPLQSLVAIDMRNSRLEEFLGLLKILNLSHSHELIRTPNFALPPQLEQLILKDCASLVEVLETLIISGCSNLDEFPKEMGNMESLKVFHADKIAMSPSTSTTSKDGLWLALISTWVIRPRKCPKLSWGSLPHSIVSLSLSDCNLHDYSFPMDFSKLPSLKKVDLSRNPICSLPDCIRGLTSLEMLQMSFCTSLQELIDLPSIRDLRLTNCSSLENITFQSKVCKAPAFMLVGCKKLVQIEGRFKLENVENLDNEVMYQHDLQALNSFKVEMFNVPHDRGIINIFQPGGEVPGCFSSKSVGSSVSITVPPPSSSFHGLNVRVVYAFDEHWGPCFISQMDNGDQLKIKLSTGSGFKVKEIGVRLVYYKQAHSSDDFIPTEVSHWKFWMGMDSTQSHSRSS
ncbi:hypothetical protein LguiA_005409 [Lonicera macranthoides]